MHIYQKEKLWMENAYLFVIYKRVLNIITIQKRTNTQRYVAVNLVSDQYLDIQHCTTINGQTINKIKKN